MSEIFKIWDEYISPATDEGMNIGSSTLEFKDLYIDGVAYIDSLGESLLVASNNQIQFRDTAVYIASLDDGHLDLEADVSIDINGPWTASGQTCADLGTVTTADIDGGTLDGVTIAADCTQTEWDTAYTHSQDNTQAHTDYMLNTGDTVTGNYTFDSGVLYVDATNNRVGMNTTSPASILHVVSDGTNISDFFRVQDNQYGVGFRTQKARGAIGSETTLQTSDVLFQFNVKGYAATAYKQAAKFGAKMDAGTISDASFPAYLYFATTPDGAVSAVDRMVIKEDGKVGINEATPNQILTLGGTLSLKEQASANADTAAYGQLWVKTATPNELWFTDDAGTDTQLA